VRIYIAIPVLALSALALVPLAGLQAAWAHDQIVERREAPLRAVKRDREERAAIEDVTARGLAAVPLPPTPLQTWAIISRIDVNKVSPALTDSLITYYRTVPSVLLALANKQPITPRLLDRVFAAARALGDAGVNGDSARDVMHAVVHNP